MKATKEIRLAVNRARALRGKPNGVVPYLFDYPIWERKMAKNKRLARNAIATLLLLVCIPANAINRQDLIDCLRGVPVDVICPDP